MKVPFLTKKNKQIIADNNQRIVDLALKQQVELINRTKLSSEHEDYISMELLLQQLVQENNELKTVVDAKEELLSTELKGGQTYVFEIGKASFQIHRNVKIKSNESKIVLPSRTIDIREKEKVGRYRTGKWIWAKVVQFRAYFVEEDGEYTYDPIDETMIEIKKKNEAQLKLGHTMVEVDFANTLMLDIGERKGWAQYATHITCIAIVFLFLLFIGLFFGGYNMTKVG